MLKIRLQRLGRKKLPVYRVVVAEHSARVKGRYVEALGHYDPLLKKDGLTVDQEKINLWIKKGAKPTNTIARLLKGMGAQGMDSYVIEMKDRPKKNPTEAELAAAKAASQPVAAAPLAEEAPVVAAAPVAEEAPVVEEAPTEVAA